jgi:hypothetical protein
MEENLSNSLLEKEKDERDSNICCLSCMNLNSSLNVVLPLNHITTRSPLLVFDNTNHPSSGGQGDIDAPLILQYNVKVPSNYYIDRSLPGKMIITRH